jgi:predicted DNA-binding WGR domain protein
MSIEIRKLYLTCTTGSSNKFYEVSVSVETNADGSRKYILQTTYGRIGTNGKTNPAEVCVSVRQAETRIADIVDEKTRKKAYDIDSNWTHPNYNDFAKPQASAAQAAAQPSPVSAPPKPVDWSKAGPRLVWG